MVDHTCKVSGAETVVNIDDTDAAGAGIKHGKECGQASEGCSVADAGRNSDHRAGGKSSDDTGQGALHARNCDNDARGLDFATPTS